MPLSPYDDLFKSIFSAHSRAMAFLQEFLPPAISEGLDFSTLGRDPDSYVDEQLKSHFTDMVYSCRWKGFRGSITVGFLLEHKSFVPKNIHLLRHRCNIYEKQLEKSGRLNLVIPIVICHGSKPWKVRSFSSYFPLPLPGMARCLPEFDYEFLDPGKVEDDEVARIRAYPLRHG